VKHIVLSLVLAMGLVSIQTPVAHASAFCDIFGEGFPGCGVLHGVPETYCQPHDILARGSAPSHEYTFGLTCDSGQEFSSISASFNANTLIASERISADGQTVTQIFVCGSDPWLATVTCYEAITHAGGPPTPDYANPDSPASAGYLDSSGYQAFGMALQIALNQSSAAVPPSRPVDTNASGASCVACAAHLAPSLPDLALTDIRPEDGNQLIVGATAIYDIVVANTGAKLSGSGQVQVQIQISGSVQYYAMAQTPSGFNCNDSSPVICVGPIGGFGDPPITTSVTFRLQIQGSRSGIGSVSAAADPNNLIQESDENNNASTLPIIVK
jgi:CARDB